MAGNGEKSPADNLSIASKDGNVMAVKEMLRLAPQISQSLLKLLSDNEPLPTSNAGLLVRLVDTQGYTALHWAALENKLEVAKILLEAGALPNHTSTSGSGQTPVHWAAINGHVEMLILLTDHGGNVHIVDNHGFNPLHYSAKNGHPLVMHFLIGRGVDKVM